jgi:hypothetical protein
MTEDQNISLPPNDIQPLLEVTDYSIYYFYSLIIISVIILIFLLYLLFLVVKKLRDPQIKERQKHINILKELNFIESPKESAYLITLYGRKVANSERSKKILEELNSKLMPYKYIKEEKKIPADVINYFHVFMEIIETEG